MSDGAERRMGAGRRFGFALAAVSLSTLVTLCGLLAVDLYLHRRHERYAALNIWGYRGPLLGPKQPGERRVVVLGGSAAFGYGVTADQAISAYVERQLSAHRPPGRPVRVANLGYNNEGAFSFRATLDDYEFLKPDVAVFYEGYNDLDRGLNDQVFRRESPIFRLTGYMPILPLVLREKAMLLWWGSLEKAYRAQTGNEARAPVFRPGLATRGNRADIEQAKKISEALARQLGPLSGEPDLSQAQAEAGGCGQPWTRYCRAVAAAVEQVIARNRHAVIVTQPYRSDRHVEQQAALAKMIRARFAGERRVHYVNLGRAIDLRDLSLTYDGLHLVPRGNEIIAARLAPVVGNIIKTLDEKRAGRNGGLD